MKRLVWQLVIAGLALGLRVSAEDTTASPNPFFAFDNGVGRGSWTVEQQASLLKQLGYDGIGYTGTANLPERLRILHEHGLRVFSIYVSCRVDRQPAFSPELATAIRQLHGQETCVWLTVQGKADSDRSAVTAVREIGELARAQGVRVVLYPHYGMYVATTRDALRIVRQVDLENVGVAFNLCHELRSGLENDIEAVLREAGPRLFLVSINGADHQGGWNRLIRPLGEGEFDVARVLRALRRLNYRGPIGLQCYNIKQAPRTHLSQSIAAWRKLSAAAARQ